MEKPIRILDIITTAQGGKRLLECRVSAINRDPDFIDYLVCPEDPLFTGGFAEKDLHFTPFPMSRGLNPLAVFGETIRFIKLLKRIPVDIVHAHTSKAGAVSRIGCALYNWGKKNPVYVCYQIHSFYFNTLGGIKRAVFLRFEQILSRLSDALLFQNDYEKDQGKQYGMDKKALLINIGNGINLSEFYRLRKIRTLPAWRGKNPADPEHTPKDPFIIICVARVEPKKNHPMLIDGAKLLRHKIKELYGDRIADSAFKIICVGEIGGPHVVSYAAEQGLGRMIEFTGVKDRREVALLLEKSRLSVLTSTAEGKPRSLMEAMSMGIPCIATDVCGTRDVIDHGKTGFLVPLNDTESFASRILQLMQDPPLYRRFCENSIKKAQNEFDETAVIERLKTLYREKPGKPPRPASFPPQDPVVH
jgi:glycosyltransferase involved in cell wall biosynthesis